MARKKRKRVASRGSVNNIILRTLVNGDKYGYEIIKEVEEYSDGKIQLKQPSLYSSLSRFEEKKFVTSYWGDSDIGGRRHYYHLTEDGLSYYKRVVLKESDDEEDVEQVLEDNNIELSTNQQDNEEPEIDDNSMTLQEIDDNEIPEIANFEDQEPTSEPVPVVYDHKFHSTTPMESMLSNVDTDNKTTPIDNQTENMVEIITESTPTTLDNNLTYLQKFNQLRDNTKASNKKLIDTNYNKLFIKKPKKIKIVVQDSDGILKLRDEDYIPSRRREEVIIDNVIKRSNANAEIFGYASYTSNIKDQPKTQTPTTTINHELTEEEKRQKNENFLAKFNLLTMSKMKPVSAPMPKPAVEERKPEPKIDYVGKLNAVIENNNTFIEENDLEDLVDNNQNNIFNYDNDDNWNTSNTTQPQTYEDDPEIDLEDNEDEIFAIEEPETFETKANNNEYIEEINSYTAPPTQVKMTRYDNVTQAVLVDKTYLLINKLKMVFGIIMSLLMIAEVTSLLLIFKNADMFSSSDKTIFIIAYSIIGLFALIYIIPFFMNSNCHKANNFKLKYSVWFGILTFLVGSILIYCINALAGFELDNFKFFAVKLIVPMVLTFNFVIAPLVYQLLLKNRSFYD